MRWEEVADEIRIKARSLGGKEEMNRSSRSLMEKRINQAMVTVVRKHFPDWVISVVQHRKKMLLRKQSHNWGVGGTKGLLEIEGTGICSPTRAMDHIL